MGHIGHIFSLRVIQDGLLRAERWKSGSMSNFMLYGRYCRSHIGYFSHIGHTFNLCVDSDGLYEEGVLGHIGHIPSLRFVQDGMLVGGVSVEMVCCYQISAEVGLGLILGIGHICHIRHTSFWTFLHCVCRDGMLLSVLV